jgi:putative PEP-CTERM system TPR-repeat lipoprotein
MKTRSARTLFTALVVSVLASACSGNDPQEHLASAKGYLQKNDPKSATIEIKNALQANPELGEARFLLGTILLKEGNPSAAEIEFRKALAAKHPDNVVIPELTRSMLMLGQAKKVVDEFGNTQLDQPAANASLQTSLAAAYAALDKAPQAEAALAAALQADANHAPALLIRARQMAAKRDIDGAIQTTEAVIARDATDADAWKMKGDLLLFGKAKPDDALAAYRKSFEVRPEFVAGHAAAVTLLIQQRKFDEAATQLAQLKKVAPQNPQTKYFEAQLSLQNKDYKLARELTQQLLRNAPNSPLILQLAGAAELQLKSLAQAEAYLTKAVQAAPQLAPARRLLIATYLRSGQPAKALTALNDATGKEGLEPGLYSLAGEVYLQNGDAKKAEEYFAKALKLDPTDAKKRTALAVTHLASGKTETGFDELQDIAASDTGATADLALISVHLRRKEFDKALAAIDNLEKKQPDKPLAANLRGRVQLAQKDTAGARKSFERALAIDPSYFAAAASLASMDMADKKPEDARKRFESLLGKNPKDGRALLAMAQLSAVNGAGKDEVAALLDKAVAANPEEITPRLLLIDLFLRNNDIKQAMTVAQSGVTTLPNNADLLDGLGRVQSLSGDHNQAIATYSKVVALRPLSPQPHLRLAEAQLLSKNSQAAEQSLRKALELKPELLEAQAALIALLAEGKRYQDAMKIARTVQEQRPKASAGYSMEGDILLGQKNWDAAAAAYRTGLERAPSTILATRLHSVLLTSGKTGEAERFAAAWSKEHPKDAAFFSHLADMALVRKDFVVAEKNYRAQIQIQPDNAVALNNLAWVTGQLGKDGAIASAEQANKLAPNQPAFMDTLAMLLAEKGEFSRAIDLQNKALALQPSNAGVRLNLAKIHIKAGDKVRARTELDTLAKLGDKYPRQSEVSSLLKSL